MRAAGLLPLLLLLLGVSSQDDANSANQEQTPTTMTAKTTTTTTPASPTDSSSTTSAPQPSTEKTTTTTTTTTTTQQAAPQPAVAAATSTQITTTTTKPATPSSPTVVPPITLVIAAGATSSASTTQPHTSGQDSSSHGATTSKTTSAASSTTSQQLSSAAADSRSSGTTDAAKPFVTNATSPPGAVGPLGTSSPGTQPQGNQPLDHLPGTPVSTTVPRTDPSQSSKDCAVPPSQCATKQPPPSSSSPVQGPSPPTRPGSTGTSVTSAAGSSSVTVTPTSQPGIKDTIPEAATMTSPGADQSTHDVGSSSAKPTTSASQSPASTQPPASGDQADQTESCSSGHQHPNISFPNKLICEDQAQHTRPTIQLKEPRTCAEWRTASSNNSFFETFCSTAQHVFDASRDRCTVTLMACKPRSHRWAVWVVLHHPLDSEEVLKELKEKKDMLEELGIVNITSDKMVEDMTINDEFSTPLIITIITLAGSLLLVAAIYGCHQRFSQKKDQNIHPDVPGFDDGHVALIFNQRLTEEMQTMENGYHDNPTLEVMETSSEMQEKKVNLNGELGDSWIVPLDTLMKEDLEEEEDTHL